MAEKINSDTLIKEPSFETLICQDCQKKFAGRKKLNLHITLCHKVDAKQHICTICDKQFKVLSNLRRHRRALHLSQCQPRKNAAACHLCSYTCRDRHQLYIHLRRHSQERPFVCEPCGGAFASQADCGRHKARYCPGQPKNACPTCATTFKNIQLLNNHFVWDSRCGRLRQLQLPSPPSLTLSVGKSNASLEIFRLQTDDSDNDIVGARLCSSDNQAAPAANLVAASRRRVRCGVCINCSRGQDSREPNLRCLHPVRYYKMAKTAAGDKKSDERIETE